jgi:hypothetical protein
MIARFCSRQVSRATGESPRAGAFPLGMHVTMASGLGIVCRRWLFFFFFFFCGSGRGELSRGPGRVSSAAFLSGGRLAGWLSFFFSFFFLEGLFLGTEGSY